MKLGDFTELAKNYINRPAYSKHIIRAILGYAGYSQSSDFKIADIGAGTGKLTKVLLELGLHVTAVEPNSQMREEGISYTSTYNVEWLEGSGEVTTLPDSSFDLAIMASSFHWTDPQRSLPEFKRILKPGGYFSAIWNPRNIQSSELHTDIENSIYEIAPNIKRVSSGSKTHTREWEEVITSTGDFKNVIFMETDHTEIMSKERYLGAWRSVNDIRSQAGKEKFEEIMKMIEGKIAHLEMIEVPYKMRSWTAQSTK